MPKTNTPEEAVAAFKALQDHGVHDSCVAALEKAAKMVEDEAKRVIGTYEYGWPPLQPETVARKGADTPLFETGALRDSIEHYVDPRTLSAQVGSNDPTALWQELGTSRGIPPRSFLMGAAMRKEKDIHELTGVTVHGLIVKDLSGG